MIFSYLLARYSTQYCLLYDSLFRKTSSLLFESMPESFFFYPSSWIQARSWSLFHARGFLTLCRHMFFFFTSCQVKASTVSFMGPCSTESAVIYLPSSLKWSFVQQYDEKGQVVGRGRPHVPRQGNSLDHRHRRQAVQGNQMHTKRRTDRQTYWVRLRLWMTL